MAVNAGSAKVGGERLIKYFANTSAGAADHVVLAAPGAGLRYRVVGHFFSSNATNIVTFYSGGQSGGTAIYERPLATGQDVSGMCDSGIFVTDANETLTIYHSGAARVSGVLIYVVEAALA